MRCSSVLPWWPVMTPAKCVHCALRVCRLLPPVMSTTLALLGVQSVSSKGVMVQLYQLWHQLLPALAALQLVKVPPALAASVRATRCALPLPYHRARRGHLLVVACTTRVLLKEVTFLHVAAASRSWTGELPLRPQLELAVGQTLCALCCHALGTATHVVGGLEDPRLLERVRGLQREARGAAWMANSVGVSAAHATHPVTALVARAGRCASAISAPTAARSQNAVFHAKGILGHPRKPTPEEHEWIARTHALLGASAGPSVFAPPPGDRHLVLLGVQLDFIASLAAAAPAHNSHLWAAHTLPALHVTLAGGSASGTSPTSTQQQQPQQQPRPGAMLTPAIKQAFDRLVAVEARVRQLAAAQGAPDVATAPSQSLWARMLPATPSPSPSELAAPAQDRPVARAPAQAAAGQQQPAAAVAAARRVVASVKLVEQVRLAGGSPRHQPKCAAQAALGRRERRATARERLVTGHGDRPHPRRCCSSRAAGRAACWACCPSSRGPPLPT